MAPPRPSAPARRLAEMTRARAVRDTLTDGQKNISIVTDEGHNLPPAVCPAQKPEDVTTCELDHRTTPHIHHTPCDKRMAVRTHNSFEDALYASRSEVC